jgi:outer membrane lipoprotein-sorting protein
LQGAVCAFSAPLIAALLLTTIACGRFARIETSSAEATDKTQPSTQSAPLTWSDIADSYDRIQSYQCVYEKEERAISNGEKQTIRVSFRKPFNVRLDWLGEGGKIDQTAVYRQGFNDGKVLARQHGLLGAIAGTLRLDPNDKLALSDSAHPITEMGIGLIIDRAKRDIASGNISLKFAGEETLLGRSAYRFEFTAGKNEGVAGLADARRAVIWIDSEMKLPIKVEIYDGRNTLLERHSFLDLRLNVNLPDKTFTL